MPQGSFSQLPILLALLGYAMAGLSLWPSLHVALSNASVFVDFSSECNSTTNLSNTLSLVDMETNTSLLTRNLPNDQLDKRIEFSCTHFLYAGTFRFHLKRVRVPTADSHGNDTDDAGTCSQHEWWSTELQVHWPVFHISVDRANNHSGSFQVVISTNEHFQSCSSNQGSTLYLEVSYLEYNQIGRNSIDKVRTRTSLPIKPLRSQSIELSCAFPFTERDFIRVALRSPHTNQEIKSSGPLYLARIFPYKLLVDNTNVYRSGCEGTMTVKLVTPPCAQIIGKVLLYRDGPAGKMVTGASGTGVGGTALGSFGPEELSTPPLAYNWLTQGENETEFNCSVFHPGRYKYCFHFVFNYSRSPSLAHTCLVVHRSVESWGPWQPWSVCSVTCGDGVRERVRECVAPSGVGGIQCTGIVKEQSLCSLEDCTGLPLPSPSIPPVTVGVSPLGSNVVAVGGISLCLAVIVATVLVTLWRKLCRTPQCSSVRKGSMHSPGGRKLSDEASICGHSLQRPSVSDGQGPQAGLAVALNQTERLPVGCQPLSQPLVIPLAQDPERLSPSGQKVLPPIFGYRLAQQQLKEMKKKGLKEATQLYHVSSSPVHDTLLDPSASPVQNSTPIPGGPSPSVLNISPVPLDLQDESNHNSFRITAPFPEHRAAPHTTRTMPDRLSPRVELVLGPPVSSYEGVGSSKRRDRTADWVEMVERSGLGGLRRGGGETGGGNSFPKNPNFRRTSSFNDTKPQVPPSAPSRQFRERSMTQVPMSRTLPEGSSRSRAIWENQQFPPLPTYPIPEQEALDWARAKSRPHMNDQRRPRVDSVSACLKNEVKHTGTNTTTISPSEPAGKADLNSTNQRPERQKTGGSIGVAGGGTSGIGGPMGPIVSLRGGDQLGVERAEQNWNRRGPSPIQRNILARKLKEAQSCSGASGQKARQRSSTFSVSTLEQRKGRCRSLPMSGDFSSSGGSPYGLSEAEQRMLDLDLSPTYLGDE